MEHCSRGAPPRTAAARARAALPGLALGLALLLAPAARGQHADPAPPERGAELYARHCAACHGETGRGDGPAAYLLSPRPRNFVGGSFRIVSTDNGVPGDDDLQRVLRDGMPGTAMPPWSHLQPSDRSALVATVRRLLVEGRVADDLADDPDLSPEEALEDVLDDYSPGAPAALPPPPPPERLDAARGAALYAQACAACHGDDGRAEVAVALVDSDGFPTLARDFTTGLFKGGGEPRDIGLRIFNGMPGSPMAALPLPQDDLWSLVRHVQGLRRPAPERPPVAQQVLAAVRVDGPLTADPGADVWRGGEGRRIGLMPLWWRQGSPEVVQVSARHDGRRLALRLVWPDATPDDLLLGQQDFTDAVAVQLSGEADPPFFGMGDPAGAVTLWHWKAAWQRDVARGVPGLREAFPHESSAVLGSQGAPDDGVFATAAAAGNAFAAAARRAPVEELVASGQGTLSPWPQEAAPLAGAGHWRDGAFTVVLLRELQPPLADGTPLSPGGSVSIAFAVWDGAAGDRNGTKSVSAWHRLALEE